MISYIKNNITFKYEYLEGLNFSNMLKEMQIYNNYEQFEEDNYLKNISNNIIITRRKGHANQYFYTFERVISEDIPISDTERFNYAYDKLEEINEKYAESSESTLDSEKEDKDNGQ